MALPVRYFQISRITAIHSGIQAYSLYKGAFTEQDLDPRLKEIIAGTIVQAFLTLMLYGRNATGARPTLTETFILLTTFGTAILQAYVTHKICLAYVNSAEVDKHTYLLLFANGAGLFVMLTFTTIILALRDLTNTIRFLFFCILVYGIYDAWKFFTSPE